MIDMNKSILFKSKSIKIWSCKEVDIVFPLDIINGSIYKWVEKPVPFFVENFYLKKALS